MKIVIVDDEENARIALKGMISSNFPDIEVLGEATNVPEAVKAIHKLKPDVVLLDIEMPGYLGIDLLDFFDINEIQFKIIFITAYNNYALQAFDLAAVDYLLKPTRVEQLRRAFERVNLEDNNTENYLTLKENLENKSISRIAFQTAEGLEIHKTQDILYLKADGSYTHIHFQNGNKITVSKSLLEYNILEEFGVFLRINRSHIVNINAVEKISKKSNGYIVLTNGEEFSISTEKKNHLFQVFKDRTF